MSKDALMPGIWRVAVAAAAMAWGLGALGCATFPGRASGPPAAPGASRAGVLPPLVSLLPEAADLGNGYRVAAADEVSADRVVRVLGAPDRPDVPTTLFVLTRHASPTAAAAFMATRVSTALTGAAPAGAKTEEVASPAGGGSRAVLRTNGVIYQVSLVATRGVHVLDVTITGFERDAPSAKWLPWEADVLTRWLSRVPS